MIIIKHSIKTNQILELDNPLELDMPLNKQTKTIQK